MIIERPPDSSALCANSCATRTTWDALTPVIDSCQAGVYGSDGSSQPVGQDPGSPGRCTPYCASIRSNTVQHRCSPIRRTGTPRVSTSACPSGVSNRASFSVDRAAPAVTKHRQLRDDVAEVEVPLADPGVGVPEAEGPVRDNDLTGAAVDQDRFERRALAGVAEVGRRQVLPGHVGAVAFLETDQERQVGVFLDVVDEEGCPLVDQEFGQDDVPHRHGHRAVGARRAGHPLVGELGVVRVIGADRHDFGSAVTDLGHPVGVRGAGHRDVGAPHHQVGGVPPVTRFRDVGLVTEHLR